MTCESVLIANVYNVNFFDTQGCRQKSKHKKSIHFKMMSVDEKKGLADLDVALSLIPDYEKQDYLHALQASPKLVASESDPIRFLRFTNFNAPAAAQGIIRYWKLRRETFQDKAFLPLTLAGGGALDDFVIAKIRSGISLTPVTDKAGCPLMYYNPGRRVIDDPQVRLRYLFFFFQSIMENGLSQTEGYVLVCLIDSMQINRDAYINSTFLLSGFPIKTKALHWVYINSGQQRTSLFRKIRDFVVTAYPRLLHGSNFFVHVNAASNDIVKQLQVHGIDRERIPLELGGDWSYWSLQEWIEQRIARDIVVNDARSSCEAAGNKNLEDHSSDPTRSRLPLKKRLKTWPLIPDTSRVKLSTDAQLNLELSRCDMTGSLPPLNGAFRDWHHFLVDGVVDRLRKCETNVIRFFWFYLRVGMDRLAENETAEIMNAARRAPSIVWEDECNPFVFLLVTDFNAFQTAKKLARYWKLRSCTFDENKYKLMHQTGEGALKRKSDVVTLDKGFAKILPNDRLGCSVVFVDPSRLDESHSVQRVRRALFYIFSVACENPKSQQLGASLILRLSPSANKATKNFANDFIDFVFLKNLIESLPIKIKEIHVLCDRFSEISLDLSRFSFAGHIYVHRGSSKHDLQVKLERFGFLKQGLPRCLNGDWGENQFNQWQELRTRFEWRVPIGLSGRDVTAFAAVRSYEPIGDKAERIRRLNIIHSRKKRTRQSIEQVLLEEECADLNNEQKRLRHEKAHLEFFLDRASQIVLQAGK